MSLASIQSSASRLSVEANKELHLLHGYQILKKLGKGSFATVYLAKKTLPNLQLYAALKKIDYRDPTATAEITILSKLPKHENVSSMYEHFVDECYSARRWCYLALEYCNGGSLNRLLREESVDSSIALQYMRDITAGVLHLHRHCVVHCDLKADNILLAPGPHRKILKITDFSIARRLSQNGRYSTKLVPKFNLGPYYSSSPEVYSSGAVTDRSDIYSLGLLLLAFFLRSYINSKDGKEYLVTPFALSKDNYGKALREAPQQESDALVTEHVIASMKKTVTGCLNLNFKKRPFAEAVLRDIDQAIKGTEAVALPAAAAKVYVFKWGAPR